MMDIKGLAWIGNVYDKFEAMCLEMEEVMYEDTVKYLENQVQTVGASVKRFYSEVMKDLHPDSYVDPVKVAAADLSLNPYAHAETKLKASAKKDARETTWKLSDDSKVISGKSKTGVYRRPIASRKSNSNANFLPSVSGPIAPFSKNLRNLSSFSQMKKSREVGSGHVDVILPSAGIDEGSRNANEKICKPMFDTGLPMSHPSVNLPATANETIVSVVSTEPKQADSTSSSSSGGLSSDSCAVGICTNSGVVSQTEKTTTGTDSRRSVVEEVIMGHQERLDDSSMDAAKNDDTIDLEVEIIEPFNESILEETCVLVEGDELHFVPRGMGSHKSYKALSLSLSLSLCVVCVCTTVFVCVFFFPDRTNFFLQKKLREVFSSKMRLKKKEYEQLAARYPDQSSNQEGTERAAPDLPAEPNTERLPAHSSETDWELL